MLHRPKLESALAPYSKVIDINSRNTEDFVPFHLDQPSSLKACWCLYCWIDLSNIDHTPTMESALDPNSKSDLYALSHPYPEDQAFWNWATLFGHGHAIWYTVVIKMVSNLPIIQLSSYSTECLYNPIQTFCEFWGFFWDYFTTVILSSTLIFCKN